MRKNYASRHAPAFILLFLSRGRNYGAALLASMEHEMPYFLGDSAMIYRTLHDLEAEGCVSTHWQTEASGPPRKFYEMTGKGWQKLLQFEVDIKQRQENFNFFLHHLDLAKNSISGHIEEEEKL